MVKFCISYSLPQNTEHALAFVFYINNGHLSFTASMAAASMAAMAAAFSVVIALPLEVGKKFR